MTDRSPLIVQYGGGVNSGAMLLGLYERAIAVDAVLFADTGGEKPETYDHIELMSEWLGTHGFPPITVVHNDHWRNPTLEGACHDTKTLPSLAFGMKSCSLKYKRQPSERWLKQWRIETGHEETDVHKCLGFDAGEPHRANRKTDGEKTHLWFPLIEWDWGREECIEAFHRHGLPVPMKSACFFCPASRKGEVRWLREAHPDLFQRALDMEQNAMPNLGHVKGLGRHWSWAGLDQTESLQGRLFDDMYIEAPCECHD